MKKAIKRVGFLALLLRSALCVFLLISRPRFAGIREMRRKSAKSGASLASGEREREREREREGGRGREEDSLVLGRDSKGKID